MKRKDFIRNESLNFVIPLIIYPFEVMVSFQQTDIELTNSLKHKGWRWDDLLKFKGDGRFIIYHDINGAVIRLKWFPTAPDLHGTLAHEIFHAATFLLDKAGAKLKVGVSDEAYAYLIGYLTTEIYKKLKT